MPSNHLILSCPLLPPSIFPSIRVFSNESVLHIRCPKDWSFSFSISPSNEYSGLISLRMDWLDLLAVQGTLKSLVQHHSSKASILRCSVFFVVQVSHPYTTTGKTIALTRRTFVGEVMSLLFNKLSRLVITFIPKSKRLLISWLQSPSAVILEPPKSLYAGQKATVTTVLRSGCTSLHSHQQCGRVLFSPHPFQHLVCRFFMMAIGGNMDDSEIVILSEVSQTQKDKYRVSRVSLTCATYVCHLRVPLTCA